MGFTKNSQVHFKKISENQDAHTQLRVQKKQKLLNEKVGETRKFTIRKRID